MLLRIKLFIKEGLCMKVFLLKDVQNIGMAGEIIKVAEGYAANFLIPKNLAVKITEKNEQFYQKSLRQVENRKEVVASKTSMLAEKIRTLTVTLKKKMHDDGKLYGAVNQMEIVEALAPEGITVAKSQVIITKAIKEKGTFEVVIKLTSQLQPKLNIKVIAQ